MPFVPHYHFIDALKTLSFVEQIWVFGSRARGDHHPTSDIDLAIVVSPQSTDDEWLKVLAIIEQADTLLKIDCVKFDPYAMGASLYQRILKDRKLLYDQHHQI